MAQGSAQKISTPLDKEREDGQRTGTKYGKQVIRSEKEIAVESVVKAVSERLLDNYSITAKKGDKTAEFLSEQREKLTAWLQKHVEDAFNYCWDWDSAKSGIDNDGKIFIIAFGVSGIRKAEADPKVRKQIEKMRAAAEQEGIRFYFEGEGDFKAGDKTFVPKNGVPLFEVKREGGKRTVVDAFTPYDDVTGISGISRASADPIAGDLYAMAHPDENLPGNMALIQLVASDYMTRDAYRKHLGISNGEKTDGIEIAAPEKGIERFKGLRRAIVNLANLLPDQVSSVETREMIFCPFEGEARKRVIAVAYSAKDKEYSAIDPIKGIRGFGDTASEAIEDMIHGAVYFGAILEPGAMYYKDERGRIASVSTLEEGLTKFLEGVDKATTYAGIACLPLMFLTVYPMIALVAVDTIRRGYEAKEAHRHLGSNSEANAWAVSTAVNVVFATTCIKPVASVLEGMAGELAEGVAGGLASSPKVGKNIVTGLVNAGLMADLGISKYYEYATHDRMKLTPEVDCRYWNADVNGKVKKDDDPMVYLRNIYGDRAEAEYEKILGQITCDILWISKPLSDLRDANDDDAIKELVNPLIAFRAKYVLELRLNGKLGPAVKSLGISEDELISRILKDGGLADRADDIIGLPSGLRGTMNDIAKNAAKKLSEKMGMTVSLKELSDGLVNEYMDGIIAWDWMRPKVGQDEGGRGAPIIGPSNRFQM
jgi:hypothetical protein